LSTLDRGASAHPVELEKVSEEEVVEWIRAIGSVRADQRVNLSAEVGGILAEIKVEVGDLVEKGDPLARLDDERLRIARDLARAEVEMARANLKKSKRDAQRQVNLFEGQVSSEYSLEQADLKARIDEGQLKVTQARLATAERDLSDASISSPVAGEITRKHVEVGELVEAGTPLFDIAKIDRVKVVVHVSELEITRIHKGQEAEISVDGHPGVIFRGSVNSFRGSSVALESAGAPSRTPSPFRKKSSSNAMVVRWSSSRQATRRRRDPSSSASRPEGRYSSPRD
jgi:RND family efflux transporter MFP subunit